MLIPSMMYSKSLPVFSFLLASMNQPKLLNNCFTSEIFQPTSEPFEQEQYFLQGLKVKLRTSHRVDLFCLRFIFIASTQDIFINMRFSSALSRYDDLLNNNFVENFIGGVLNQI